MSLNQKFIAIEKELNTLFFERSQPIRGIVLSTLSSTNILLLGPAGVGKSALLNQWNRRIKNAKFFYRLMTKYTTPEELFGPPSLKGLKEESYRRVTRGKVPEMNTIVLDEIFKSNSPILNSLLTVLNERTFDNDGDPMHLPLITVAGASNEVPESDDGLDAFMDRFLLKYYIRPIQESSNFVKMLQGGSLDGPITSEVTLDEVYEAQKEIALLPVPENVFEHADRLRQTLRKDGIMVTDRSFKTALKILKAEAWLNGQPEVSTLNIEVLKNICWTKPDQEKMVHSTILELISPEKNKILTLYQDCQDQAKSVYKHKDAAKKQTAMVEANQKIKDARVQISRLKKDMLQKKQDVTEIEKMENELEKMTLNMAQEVLGVDLSQYGKL